MRYLADSSYWLYRILLPIVVALQVAVSQFDWPGPVKFAAILVVAMPVMLASYHGLVRSTVIGAVLNGRRVRRAPVPAVACNTQCVQVLGKKSFIGSGDTTTRR